ncbi:MAG: hypothetical protein HYT50_00685 [Candidatus Wildermuthbacteria bacterium]|nr:hypothetical protein [Candidatus Wildermuthbacteria bacterium]
MKSFPKTPQFFFLLVFALLAVIPQVIDAVPCQGETWYWNNAFCEGAPTIKSIPGQSEPTDCQASTFRLHKSERFVCLDSQPPPSAPEDRPQECKQGKITDGGREYTSEWAPCSREVYSCGNNTCGKDGGYVQKATEWRQCRQYVNITYDFSDSKECKIRKSGPITEWEAFIKIENAQKAFDTGYFQTCPASANGWSITPPVLQCSGQCYPAPEITPFNEIQSPKNVFDAENSQSLKLPVHGAWKDTVEQELNKEEYRNPDSSFCKVESYRYALSSLDPTIERAQGNTPDSSTRDVVLSQSQCSGVPGAMHDFTVKACAGGTCGAPGKLSFTASKAPQLLSPYDPDWEETKVLASPPLRLKMSWCEAPQMQSYRYQIFKVEKKDEAAFSARTTPFTESELALLEKQEGSRVPNSYSDLFSNIKKDILYIWRISACKETTGTVCGPWSQQWSFKSQQAEIKPPVLKSPAYNPSNPGSIPSVNLSEKLDWEYANPIIPPHLVVSIKGGNISKIFAYNATELAFKDLEELFEPYLPHTTIYTWKVGSCLSEDTAVCEQAAPADVLWSQEWKFKPTGSPPATLRIAPMQETVIALPATLSWSASPGAGSYEWQVRTQQGEIVANGKVSARTTQAMLEYENYTSEGPNTLKKDTSYSWRVRTCADEYSQICEDSWSTEQQFKTSQLLAPVLHEPSQGSSHELPRFNLSWSAVLGASSYQYAVEYRTPATDSSQRCKTLQYAKTETRPGNSTGSSVEGITCEGTYEARIRSCLDSQCKEAGDWSSWQSFAMQEPSGISPGGLVPCGRTTDNKGTPWDELKPCGLEDMFLVIKVIIDFILWKVSLLAIIFMSIASAGVLFTSFGTPFAIQKIKQMWKALGVGILILLFSWMLLNLLLGLVGFDVNIFGKWYERQ